MRLAAPYHRKFKTAVKFCASRHQRVSAKRVDAVVASVEFLPSVAIGAFAGLRSADIERIEWSEIDLVGGHITIAASKAKTASSMACERFEAHLRVCTLCCDWRRW